MHLLTHNFTNHSGTPHGLRAWRAALRCAVLLAVIVACGNRVSAQSSRWVQQESIGRLQLYSETRLDSAALASDLNAVAAEFSGLCGVEVPSAAVEVIVFRSMRNFREYLAATVPIAMSRRAIFYRNGNTSQIYAVAGPQLGCDLRHEFTHAVLHQALPYCPLWLDEGLAEYFEERPSERDSSARTAATRWRVRSGWLPDLESLERIPSAAEMSADDYRDSWAWVSFLMNESDQSKQLLHQYLAAISAGEAPGRFSAFSAKSRIRLKERLGSYYRRFRISLR